MLKKCKKPDDVLFINAAEHFVKGKRQNQLTEEHINQIITTYQQRPKQIERYARRVKMKEIAENDYNLNISRYVSTAQQKPEIDLAATHAELARLRRPFERLPTGTTTSCENSGYRCCRRLKTSQKIVRSN